MIIDQHRPVSLSESAEDSREVAMIRLPSGSVGIIWLVDEKPDQRRRFLLSYASARRHCPSLPRVVFRHGPPLGIGVDEIPFRPMMSGAAGKFDAFAETPFETTLFLDNDTVVLRDPTRIIEDTSYVSALPYPDFFNQSTLTAHGGATDVPVSWRNVNSGVVVFTRPFMDHYREVWRRHGHLAPQLLGYDQCLFSLALSTAPFEWTPRLDLQVTTTPYALRFFMHLRRLAHVPPLLGDIPVAALMSVAVLHYTAQKLRYEKLLAASGIIDQFESIAAMNLRSLEACQYPQILAQSLVDGDT